MTSQSSRARDLHCCPRRRPRCQTRRRSRRSSPTCRTFSRTATSTCLPDWRIGLLASASPLCASLAPCESLWMGNPIPWLGSSSATSGSRCSTRSRASSACSAQFVQAANAARQNGLAVGLAPSAPPVAPLPSPPEPHQQQELPPTAPVQVSLTRDQFAQRLHQAFLSTEVWQVPEHIWTAFFAARGASPLVKDDVVLEAADGKATVKCVLCPTSCTLHWKNNCWNLSSLLSHLHNKHAAATGTKRAAPTSQLDAYWQNVRQRTTSASLSPSSAAPTAPPAAPAPAPAPATAPAQALSAPPAAQPKCCS